MKQPSQGAGEGFVPVSIEQVRAHVPSAERWQELCAKLPRQCGEEPQEVHVVVLAAESGRRLPIWVGRFEADAIRLHLDGLKTDRPLTYDLMLDVLNRHGINMVRAEVLRMADGVFSAQIVTKSNGRVETLSCRPSDALNLALRANVPITVAGTLLDDVGVDAGSDIK